MNLNFSLFVVFCLLILVESMESRLDQGPQPLPLEDRGQGVYLDLQPLPLEVPGQGEYEDDNKPSKWFSSLISITLHWQQKCRYSRNIYMLTAFLWPILIHLMYNMYILLNLKAIAFSFLKINIIYSLIIQFLQKNYTSFLAVLYLAYYEKDITFF